MINFTTIENYSEHKVINSSIFLLDEKEKINLSQISKLELEK